MELFRKHALRLFRPAVWAYELDDIFRACTPYAAWRARLGLARWPAPAAMETDEPLPPAAAPDVTAAPAAPAIAPAKGKKGLPPALAKKAAEMKAKGKKAPAKGAKKMPAFLKKKSAKK